jgi:hypothetical protein
MLSKIPPAYSKLVKGVGINYFFPEWIKKGLDNILGTLLSMGSLLVIWCL